MATQRRSVIGGTQFVDVMQGLTNSLGINLLPLRLNTSDDVDRNVVTREIEQILHYLSPTQDDC